MKEVAKLGITLALICAVAGLGLAVVYAKTKPVIDERAQQDILNAAKEVIPGATSVEQMEKDGTVYWIGKDGDKVTGAAIKVESQGFQNPIEMMVGVDSEGKIAKVKIIALSDTPGIGTRVKDESFLSRFVGAEGPSKVDGISGATFSSRAVIGGVSKAAEFLSGIVAPKQEKMVIDFAKVPDGTYEGTGNGLMGPIKVRVTVKGGKVTEVVVVENTETPGVADKALSDIPKAIVEQQRVEVDAVSGATFASKGIMEAVKNALAAFASPAGSAAIDLSKIADGTYEGTGDGLMGPIKVSVTVKGGKITEVKVVENKETPGVADKALQDVPKAIVEQQKLDVDTVSGATFASKGIIEAVKNALSGAQGR